MTKYSWKRFWYPRGDSPKLGDDGFLSDPEASPLFNFNPHLVTLDSTEEIPCLILLGEPGIGKSTSIFDNKNEISDRIQQKGDNSLWINLNAYSDEVRIINDIFNSSEFQTWQMGHNNLHVFIDSIDECLLRVETLANMFAEEFPKVITDKLFLRFICRTVVWPISLEKRLFDRYQKNQIKVYELAPLRKIDVKHAAQLNEIDADTFISEIKSKEIIPFAIKPVTLEFLIKEFKKNGKLPKKKEELYLKGCIQLCTEQNPSRLESKRNGKLSADQRLQIASRIAALTRFSKKNSIWRGNPNGDISEDDLTFEDIIIGDEIFNNRRIELNYKSINEVIDTGLFTARDVNRFGWSHQTYAEFLAAYYLFQHEVKVNQITNLITHTIDQESKLVPQLHETAAWLAGMNKEIFDRIIQSEPEILLNSDVANADEIAKSNLVDGLLNAIKKENILPNSINISTFKKIAHPNLSKQLLPYLTDKRLPLQVRNVAIDIVEACELSNLQIQIAEIVLDNSEPLPIRINAAWAISNIADSSSKQQLRQIIFSNLHKDTNKKLKAVCLRILWPDHLSASELFLNIFEPPDNEVGFYTIFLSSDLIEHLKIEDIPIALQWVSQLGQTHKLHYSFKRLIDEIMILAWKNINSINVLDAFALAVFTRIKHNDDIILDNNYSGKKLNPPFHVQLQDNEPIRRDLLSKLINYVKDQKDASHLAHHRIHIGSGNDIEWLLHKLKDTDTDIEKNAISKLIKNAFDVNNAKHINMILESCQDNAILTEEFSYYFTPVELDSTTAQDMQEEYANTQKWQNVQNEANLLDPSPKERIELCLNDFENGDLDAWWKLCHELTLTPTSTHYGDFLSPELIKLPGYIDSDKSTWARICSAAKAYITQKEPNPNIWIGKKIIYYPDIAWYKAVLLIQIVEPKYIETFDNAIWKKWAPIIIAYPTSVFDNESATQHLLIKIAYQIDPEEVLKTLSVMIDVEGEGEGRIYVTKKFSTCWDNNISKLLFEKVKDESLNTNAFTGLFEVLLDYKYKDAIKYAISLLTIPLPPQGRERELAKIAARCLITHTENKYWQVVWNALKTDSEFGKEVLLGVAYLDDHNLSIIKNLTEVELSELYLWLESNFPLAEDPAIEGMHMISPRESVANWRENILGYLQNKGTVKAIEEIQRLISSLPHLNFLKRVLLKTKEQTRRTTWKGILPSELIKIANDSKLRLVQNGDQLLEVIIESIQNFEKKLHGETPLAPYLWDKQKKKIFKPKDENSLSDLIKIHLQSELKEKGIVLNREVEIRRPRGLKKGENTDILIQALRVDNSSEEDNIVTVIIEVKGCWHPELFTAMETQLADRYLFKNQCKHGLYLVGWYGEKPCKKKTKALLKRKFETQAKKLSIDKTIKSFVLDVSL